MPVKPEDFDYRFSPLALIEVRERLGLSQARIASRLNLPVNTVSRWERGETSPDANSLAAIYSIAKGAGIEPDFFQRRADAAGNKTHAVESEFIAYLKSVEGQPVAMTDLGQQLRKIMDKHETEPEEIGLSKNHPTRSMLSRLEEQGKIHFKPAKGSDDRVTIEVSGGAAPSKRTRYFTIERRSGDQYEQTVVGKDGQTHLMYTDKKGKDGHFTNEGKYRRAIAKAVSSNKVK